MRRPALYRPTAAPSGWSHPYASPFVLYADGGDPPAGDEPTGDTTPKPAPPKTFTQEQVAALAAKEKSQGERAGARRALEEFAAELGFSNIDDAKAFVEEGRKAKEAAMSEQERREQALADRERQLAEREAAAVARERIANRRAVLVGLGATGDDLEDATALLRVADDADEQAVAEAAEALKERRPELFGARQAETPAVPVPSTPPAPGGSPAGGPPPRVPATKDDTKARARAMAIKMGYARPDAA